MKTVDTGALVQSQLNLRKVHPEHLSDERAVVLLKPGYKRTHRKQLLEFAKRHDFTVEVVKIVTLSAESTLAIYSDIYRFSSKDIVFGVEWKKRKLAYMTSAPSEVFVLRGENCQLLCEQFKEELRKKYGKLSVPEKPLSANEFEELAIKNIIHVVDATDTEVILWLLTSAWRDI